MHISCVIVAETIYFLIRHHRYYIQKTNMSDFQYKKRKQLINKR